MNEAQTTILNAAVSYLDSRDTKSFATTIAKMLNEVTTCNCFFERQGEAFWNKLKTSLVFAGTYLTYDVCLTRGFIYLQCKENYKAYVYLTNAIAFSPVSDIAFSLRAQLISDVNHDRYDDAKEAVLLNPTARNYYILANVLAEIKSTRREEIRFEDPEYQKNPSRWNYLLLDPDSGFNGFRDENTAKSLEYINKAIALNANFTCAYYFKAQQQTKLGGKSSLVADTALECTKTNDQHLEYYKIWELLFKANSKESIKIVTKGYELSPDNGIYSLALFKEYYKKACVLLNSYENRLTLRLSAIEKNSEEEIGKLRSIIEQLEVASINYNNYKTESQTSVNSDEYNKARSTLSKLTIKLCHIYFSIKNYENVIVGYEALFKNSGCSYGIMTRREEYINYGNIFTGNIYSFDLDERQGVDEFFLSKLIIKGKITSDLSELAMEKTINSKMPALLSLVEGPWKIEANDWSFQQFFFCHDRKINFGKYRDCRIEEIIDIEPAYLLNLLINPNNFFVLSSYVLLSHKLADQPDYLTAISSNLIKSRALRRWFTEHKPWQPTEEYYRAVEAFGEMEADNMREFYENEMRDMDETDPSWRIANDLS